MSVELETRVPAQFERSQLGLRLLLAVVFGWFGLTLGWMTSLLYVLLPVMAGGAVSSVGGASYLHDFAPRLWSVLTWIVRGEAYMMLLVDRFPTADDEHEVVPAIVFTGAPTTGSALVRIVTALPNACVLAILMAVATPLVVVSVIVVLVGGEMPTAILSYQRGVLRWQLRLLAYLGSLVAEYPPWHLHGDAPLAQAVAR